MPDFRARVILYSKQMAEAEGRCYDLLETWDDELTPIGPNRPTREWAAELLYDWNREDYIDHFGLASDDPYELLFEATVTERYDEFTGEYDHDITVTASRTQQLPENYFVSYPGECDDEEDS